MNFVNEIFKISNQKLSKNDLISWLENNFSNFILNEQSKKCSNRLLSCFCFERNSECLFIEIYSKLRTKAEYFELNTHLSIELIGYKKVENNEAEKKLWLLKNLKIGLDNIWDFMSLNYPNIILSFANGKLNDKYQYLRIEIDGLEFKPIYDFANLFSKLFFEDKLLPNEYEKWKYESGMTD